MCRIKQLHDLALAELLLKALVLFLHAVVVLVAVGEAQMRVVVGPQVAAKLIMRWEFGCIFGELIHSLKRGLLISQLLLLGVLLLLAAWGREYFLKVSIMGWKLVVSM
jgi:hypothetical protein